MGVCEPLSSRGPLRSTPSAQRVVWLGKNQGELSLQILLCIFPWSTKRKAQGVYVCDVMASNGSMKKNSIISEHGEERRNRSISWRRTLLVGCRVLFRFQG